MITTFTGCVGNSIDPPREPSPAWLLVHAALNIIALDAFAFKALPAILAIEGFSPIQQIMIRGVVRSLANGAYADPADQLLLYVLYGGWQDGLGLDDTEAKENALTNAQRAAIFACILEVARQIIQDKITALQATAALTYILPED